MNSNDFQGLLQTIVEKCVAFKNKYVKEKDLPIDYICVFSHSEKEFNEFLQHASTLGPIIEETKTGPVFKFTKPLQTIVGIPNVLKIRKPDLTKPQLGDVDFTTDYPNFKKEYYGQNGFSLIVREKFEMLELKDKTSDVLAYFSCVPPSKLIGVS
jgi:hypothetical protein